MVHINQFFVFCFIFYGCINTEDTNTSSRVSMKQNNYIQNLNDWKRDSLGCLRLRSLELARTMIEKNDLLGKSTEEFINYFGKPNEITKKDQEAFFVYYIEIRCKDDTFVIEEADKC